MYLDIAGFSHTGTVRTTNEDWYCVGPFIEQGTFTAIKLDCDSENFRHYGALVAVADGIGGYAGGGYASHLVLESLTTQFYGEFREGATSDQIQIALSHYFQQTLDILQHHLQQSSEMADAGTTIAGMVLACPNILLLFHAGDSRILRESAGFVLPLTTDHTVYASRYAKSRMDEDAMTAMPELMALTRSFGLHGDTRIEWNQEYSWDVGDRFILGTDGWYGTGRGISLDHLRELLRDQMASPHELTRSLVATAVNEDGTDNATVVTVAVCG